MPEPEEARPVSPGASPAALAPFREYRASGARRLRNELVEANMGVVEPHVRRYRGRGLSDDDLRQHAFMALVHAVERFDPEMGVAFSTFAGRTIDGELKRLLRDRSWSVRPPRRAQELALEVRRAEEDLSQRLGRSPTVPELAKELSVEIDDVLTALEASTARRAASLDQPSPSASGSGSDRTAGERLGTSDTGFHHAEQRMVVEELLATLPERERRVLELRFYENLGQPEIAEQLGLSQSYVSRLLRRTLLELRGYLEQAASIDPDAALAQSFGVGVERAPSADD